MGCTLLFGFAKVLQDNRQLSKSASYPFYDLLKMWWNLDFFKNIIDKCSFDLIVDRHWHELFFTYWPTNSNWRLFLLPQLIIILFYFPMLVYIKIGKQTLYNYLNVPKIVIGITRYHWFNFFETNGDKWQIRNIQIKY